MLLKLSDAFACVRYRFAATATASLFNRMRPKCSGGKDRGKTKKARAKAGRKLP